MGTGVDCRNVGARPVDSDVVVTLSSAGVEALRFALRRVVSKRNGCEPVVTKFGPHEFDVAERLTARFAPLRFRPRCDDATD